MEAQDLNALPGCCFVKGNSQHLSLKNQGGIGADPRLPPVITNIPSSKDTKITGVGRMEAGEGGGFGWCGVEGWGQNADNCN